jgi:hypothetical protein
MEFYEFLEERKGHFCYGCVYLGQLVFNPCEFRAEVLVVICWFKLIIKVHKP